MSDNHDFRASIGFQAAQIARVSERRFEQKLTPLGLTRVLWSVLLAAGQEGLEQPSQIALFAGIDRTATSRALRRLEATGMVTRQGMEDDKRHRKVVLTDKGREQLAIANRAADENAKYFASKLSWYEANILGDILQKLTKPENG